MYHSITFGTKNTWDDWHLVPVSRPVFNPPEVKTRYLDIPGGDGVIDLSESLTGYPVYENRSGSQEFILVNDFYIPVDDYEEWYEVYSEIMGYLHGQKMKAILEDDKEYYYEGRFSVNKWKSDKHFSKIVIDYNVGPYKWLYKTSIDDWLWDPFNFETGVIPENVFRNIPVSNAYTAYAFEQSLFGIAPVCPILTSTTTTGNGIDIWFINKKLDINVRKIIPDGTTQIPEFIFYGDRVIMSIRSVTGNGRLSIKFRQGRL